ncbi:MAG TPA: pitrilysin family protein [Candidatus Nanoarchaeia archaeon]|nr:pitrilysin family protein [Candidatus Nanoarchaeia archaeon]
MESLKKNFQKKVLDNGLTILFEKRDLPIVSVAFAVRTGGIDEPLEEKGVSHFIEHMLYKGTETRNNKEIAEEIEKRGGELNGFTSEEVTGYWCKMPSKHLNVALDILGDVVRNPKFDEKEIEKERKVIFEEIKMRHDVPQIYVFDEIQKCLYSGSLSVDLIGTYETMNSIKRDKILENFKKFYSPENMILTVVGDADFNEVISYAENMFTGEKEKNEIKEQPLELKNEQKTETRAGVDQVNFVLAYHVPTAEDKGGGDYAARILSSLMAEGMSSRLFSEIREKRNLAYAIKGEAEINKKFAYNFIYVGTTKEKLEEVKKLILEEFKKISESLKEEELNQIKEQLIGNYLISIEDSQEQMTELLFSEVHSKAEDFYEFEKMINQVKLEDVKELAQKVVNGEYSSFSLMPEDKN